MKPTDYLIKLARESKSEHVCECCERQLDPERTEWLGLNAATGLYIDPDVEEIPEADDQGLFPFGRTCAKKVLSNGGSMPDHD